MKLAIALVTALLLSATPVAAASAASGALPDTTRTGTLTVTRQNADFTPAADDVTVSVFRLLADGDGVPFDLGTVDGWNRVADLQLIDALTLPSAEVGSSATSGGIAHFASLDVGVFLVTVTSLNTGEPAAEPFIVTLPATSADGSEWVYDIHAYIKSGADERWAHIGGVVWNDMNRDGIRQADEPLVAGVTVHLYAVLPGPEALVGGARARDLAGLTAQSGAVIHTATTATDSDGWWEFTHRSYPMVYQVRFDLDELNAGVQSLVFTYDNADSAPERSSGITSPVELVAFDWVLVDAGVTGAAPGDPSPTPGPGQGPGAETPPRLPVTGATLAGLLVATVAVGAGVAFLIVPAQRRRREG